MVKAFKVFQLFHFLYGDYCIKLSFQLIDVIKSAVVRKFRKARYVAIEVHYNCHVCFPL